MKVTDMKNWLILTVLTLIGTSALAGKFTKEVDEFTAFRAAGNFKVVLKAGTENKVAVNNRDEDDLEDDRIIIEEKEGELIVRIKSDTYSERDMEMVVTYTKLEKVTAKLGAEISVKTPLTGEFFKFDSESGGKIKATVQAKSVKAEISTGGSIHLDGKVDEAKFKINMGGTIGAVSLVATKVKATVTAGGEIICNATDDLSIKITSGGNVSYVGEPEAYEQNITLGGKISKIKDPLK